ncbi:MAG: carboxypeptidase-like regulatory domain-containing protein [Chroococcales cyanobacterium]
MKSKYLLPLLISPILAWPAKALAHGTDIEYRQVSAIQIEAAYAGGQPMANAQVVVYAPNNPATPWIQGTTDEEGRFSFVPDATQSGNWEVKVRQAGHGQLITIPLDEIANETSDTQVLLSSEQSEYTPLQKILLGFAGVWGFVGTALFFARRNTD